MRTTFFSYIFLSATLYGCSSEISTVKEGRLQGLPEYTISQALDNRKICHDTDWSSFRDEKGRKIVRYKCDMKNIKELYYEIGQNLVNESKARGAEERIEEEINHIERKIAENKNRIDKEIPEEEAKLSRDRLAISDQMAQQRKNNKEETTENKIPLKKFLSLKRQSDDLKMEFYSLKTSILNMKEKLIEKKALLEKTKKINQDNLNLGRFILDNYESTDAYETIDWLVIEKNNFLVLGGSLHEKGLGESDFKETIHPDIEFTIETIYSDQAQDYFEYRELLGY